MTPSRESSSEILSIGRETDAEALIATAVANGSSIAPASNDPDVVARANAAAVAAFAATRPRQIPILDEEMPHCNDNCIHCGVSEIMAGARDISTLEVFGHLESLRSTGADSVMFAVSELTIRPDFVRIVRAAQRLGFKTIAVVTNARRMAYREFAESTVEAGATHFLVSVYGATARVHQSMTRTPESFAQTIAGLDHLLDLPATVMTNTVITQRNVGTLSEIVGFLGDRGVKRSCLSLVQIIGSAKRHADRLLVRMADAAPAVRAAIEIGRSRQMIMGVGGMPYCQLPELASAFGVDDLSAIHNADPRDQITSKSPYESVEACGGCSHVAVCPGVQEEYLALEGGGEVAPIQGPRLTRRPDSDLGLAMFPELFRPCAGTPPGSRV
jgi:MoaA/NifB/PqqE/SkfB family radical SAM enzyme